MHIKVENLTKKIRNQEVLYKINLEFFDGNIYGVIGQNGSGKTMLLRAISGLIRPTEGKVIVDGKQLFKEIDFPPNLGIIIEKPEVLGYLSGLENLKLLAEINGKVTVNQIKDYLSMFSLDPENKQSMKKYSLGMKQKIGIIQAIMEDPEILILDEPFNALDQETVDIVRSILMDMKQKGKIIIITSHHNDDIEGICNEIIRLNKGRIVC